MKYKPTLMIHSLCVRQTIYSAVQWEECDQEIEGRYVFLFTWVTVVWLKLKEIQGDWNRSMGEQLRWSVWHESGK